MTRFLPAGLIGLILAAILSASMSASSAELNALASVTVLDLYKRIVRKNAPERHYLLASKAAVLACYFFTAIPYLWFNVIGCLILIVLANSLNPLFAVNKQAAA